jgi:uncharacterized protein YdeI (YjbR/CyaY-like superfamily)
MAAADPLPVVAFDSTDSWEEWLAARHASEPGVWVRIAKAGSAMTSVSYSDALDIALCYGWIDGQKGALDERYWRQRFTPRTPRSRWSKINRERAEALIAAGRMRPAGQREVAAAQADGRWAAAYEGQKTATVPADLRAALDANPAADAFFATLNSINRYAILYRVQDAKRPATRAARIEKFVAMLERGEKIHP